MRRNSRKVGGGRGVGAKKKKVCLGGLKEGRVGAVKREARQLTGGA